MAVNGVMPSYQRQVRRLAERQVVAESTSSTEVVDSCRSSFTTAMRDGRKKEAESLAAHRHVKSRGVKSQDTRARIRQRLPDSEADRRQPVHLDGSAHGPPRMP